ncbi:MAG: GTP-binding protein [Acidimicrobiaceae bacterium]|nr:GTP-binding protein [Acidimicrobiaceae bacterium]
MNLDAILGIQAFEISQRAAAEPSFLENHYVHSHDPDVETFSVRIVGELDRGLVEAAAREIAADHGADLLRWKGVLAIAGNDRRVALQGVHRIFEMHDLDRWEGTHRDSRVVFIGKNLDRDRLAGCLQRCVAGSQRTVPAT